MNHHSLGVNSLYHQGLAKIHLYMINHQTLASISSCMNYQTLASISLYMNYQTLAFISLCMNYQTIASISLCMNHQTLASITKAFRLPTCTIEPHCTTFIQYNEKS